MYSPLRRTFARKSTFGLGQQSTVNAGLQGTLYILRRKEVQVISAYYQLTCRGPANSSGDATPIQRSLVSRSSYSIDRECLPPVRVYDRVEPTLCQSLTTVFLQKTVSGYASPYTRSPHELLTLSRKLSFDGNSPPQRTEWPAATLGTTTLERKTFEGQHGKILSLIQIFPVPC